MNRSLHLCCPVSALNFTQFSQFISTSLVLLTCLTPSSIFYFSVPVTHCLSSCRSQFPEWMYTHSFIYTATGFASQIHPSRQEYLPVTAWVGVKERKRVLSQFPVTKVLYSKKNKQNKETMDSFSFIHSFIGSSLFLFISSFSAHSLSPLIFVKKRTSQRRMGIKVKEIHCSSHSYSYIESPSQRTLSTHFCWSDYVSLFG